MKTKTLLTTLIFLIAIQMMNAQITNNNITGNETSAIEPNHISDWELISFPDYQANLKAVYFYDDNHGWIIDEFATIYFTTDGGLTWDNHFFGPSIYLEDVYFLDQNIGFVIGNFEVGGPETKAIVYKTNDGGKNWETSFLSESSMIINSISFSGPANGFISGFTLSPNGFSAELYKTADFGISWEYIPIGINLSKIENIEFNKEVGKEICVGWLSGTINVGPTEVSVIMNSVDEGENWKVVYNRGEQFEFNDIYFLNGHEGIALGENGLILTTIDRGENWMAQYMNQQNLNAAIVASNNQVLILGDNGFLMSSKIMERGWTRETTLLDTDLNAVCETPGGNLWAVGAEGTVYKKTPTSAESNGNQDLENIASVSLKNSNNSSSEENGSSIVSYKNYPNPFSGNTTISFELNQETNVKIDVYSMNGQLINRIKDQHYDRGVHEVLFDANGLTPGIYTYILTAGNHVENGKMIISR